ncbi:MAG: hypothetical protein Q8M92_04065 [Candidatus Subteraquimicrobiales bacterium]|nr:hypothetical protein [Candidatus Subteraquimicrobiales bacterium]
MEEKTLTLPDESAWGTITDYWITLGWHKVLYNGAIYNTDLITKIEW